MWVIIFAGYYTIFKAIITVILLLIVGCFLWVSAFLGKRSKKRNENIIKHFKSIQYGELIDTNDISRNHDWSIWLEDFQPDHNVVVLPCKTQHVYHIECISQWMQNNNSCPYDRQKIRARDIIKMNYYLKRRGSSFRKSISH